MSALRLTILEHNIMEHEVEELGAATLDVTDGVDELVGLDPDPGSHKLTPEQCLLQPLNAPLILGHLNLWRERKHRPLR